MDDKESEKRVLALLHSPRGLERLKSSVEQALHFSTPRFVTNVKGKVNIYKEVILASHTIVDEELKKGEDGLYYRIRDRVNNYWENKMS